MKEPEEKEEYENAQERARWWNKALRSRREEEQVPIEYLTQFNRREERKDGHTYRLVSLLGWCRH